jgi:hypothetical protein
LVAAIISRKRSAQSPSRDSSVCQCARGSHRPRNASRSICTCVNGKTESSSRSALATAGGWFHTIGPCPERTSTPFATRSQIERSASAMCATARARRRGRQASARARRCVPRADRSS